MNRPKSAHLLAIALAAAVALLSIAGCGGDDEPAEPAEPETPTTTAESIDATAFKDCILNASVDRGVYEEVPSPSPALQQVADDAGAEFFEAGKADDGLVLFYLPEDPAAAGELVAPVESALDGLAATLAEGGPKNVTLGATSVETEGPVVLGLLPFSEQKTDELTEETLADVADCVSEA